jgi:hypothetical protein
MPPALTDEQRQALLAADARGPVTIVDPLTDQTYVLLRADLFERCKTLFDKDDFDVSAAYCAMDAVAGREGWLDAEMDAYDALDPRRPS